MHRARSGGPTCRHLQYPPTPSQSHSGGPPVTEVVIAAASRTPVGKYGRAFRNVEAVKLGSTVISEAVNRAGLVPADIEEVLMGNVISAGLGQNPARQAALFGGLPERVGATTINKVCGSGLQAVMFASDMIRSVPVEVPGAGRVEVDEGIRTDTSFEKLARLPPVFREGGMVTAGNASQLSDGAAAMVVLSEEAADRHGVKPLARVVAYNTVGVKPESVMEAPIPGVRKLLKKTGLSVDDIDLFEHNEAYAAASLVVMRELGIPHEKFNVNGGAVALGHPIGCSGARVLTTLIYAMKDRGAKRGLATLCLGGGNAVSMIIERP